MITRAKDGTFKHKILTANKYHVPIEHVDVEPTCFSEAHKDPQWRTVICTEINALIHNVTWTLVSYRPNMNIVGNKWVFKLKRKADVSIDWYKARLVAKGFH